MEDVFLIFNFLNLIVDWSCFKILSLVRNDSYFYIQKKKKNRKLKFGSNVGVVNKARSLRTPF